MELSGKLVQMLPLQTGQGKNGEWRKQEIILETEGQYPKKVCIAIWGDKINTSQLVLGNRLTVSFDVESREYNGKWYTDVKAWKVDAAGANTGNSGNSGSNSESNFSAPQQQSAAEPQGEYNDDLPF
jgi:hypothetical protein